MNIEEYYRKGHQVKVKIDGQFNVLTLKFLPGDALNNSYGYNTINNTSCHSFSKPLEFIAKGKYPTVFRTGGHVYEILDRRK